MTSRTATFPDKVQPWDPGVARAIRGDLVAWYRSNCRPLPWRQTRDAYRIWVSEVMLQQTRVSTVVEYYQRWVEAFPTVQSLAAAPQASVLKNWEGLGYYSRARNLHAAAQCIVRDHQGTIPSTATALRALPGIGQYTAGAVASIAYGQPEPAIDGNVNRVITRLRTLRGNPQAAPARRAIDQSVRALLTARNASALNQALMELGASHCSPTKPSCWQCPVREHCLAYKNDSAEQFPQTAPRKSLIKERHALGLVRWQDQVAVTQLPEHAPRWANLWVFPNLSVDPDKPSEEALRTWLKEHLGLRTAKPVPQPSLRHYITRYQVDLDVIELQVARPPDSQASNASYQWKTLAQLRALAMPAPHRKVETRYTAALLSAESEGSTGCTSSPPSEP